MALGSPHLALLSRPCHHCTWSICKTWEPPISQVQMVSCSPSPTHWPSPTLTLSLMSPRELKCQLVQGWPCAPDYFNINWKYLLDQRIYKMRNWWNKGIIINDLSFSLYCVSGAGLEACPTCLSLVPTNSLPRDDFKEFVWCIKGEK
jgi:hypothetical protein